MLHQNKHSSNFRISPKRKVSLYIKDSNKYICLFIQITDCLTLLSFSIFLSLLTSSSLLSWSLLQTFNSLVRSAFLELRHTKIKQEGEVYFTLPYQHYNYWSYLTQDRDGKYRRKKSKILLLLVDIVVVILIYFFLGRRRDSHHFS